MIISCGVIPVRIENDEPLYLLLRVHTQWDFPRGRKEPGESDLETAVRETQEETSIEPANLFFDWATYHYETEPYKTRQGLKVVRYFVGWCQQKDIHLPVNPELGKPEHNEFRWCSYDEAKSLANERVVKVLDWAHNIVRKQ